MEKPSRPRTFLKRLSDWSIQQEQFEVRHAMLAAGAAVIALILVMTVVRPYLPEPSGTSADDTTEIETNFLNAEIVKYTYAGDASRGIPSFEYPDFWQLTEVNEEKVKVRLAESHETEPVVEVDSYPIEGYRTTNERTFVEQRLFELESFGRGTSLFLDDTIELANGTLMRFHATDADGKYDAFFFVGNELAVEVRFRDSDGRNEVDEAGWQVIVDSIDFSHIN